MEIKLKDFVEQVFANRPGDENGKPSLGIMIRAMLDHSEPGQVLIRVKREPEYVQLVLPVPDTNKVGPLIDFFSETYKFSYIMESDAVLLNFYNVPGMNDVSGIVVEMGGTHVQTLKIISQLLEELNSIRELYNQLEGYYSSMEKFMFMVEGLKNYRLLEVERFLNEQLSQIVELEKFAIYISETDDSDRLRLLSWAPKGLGQTLPKTVTRDDLEKFTDYFIVEMEMHNINGYFLYRPKAYANIDDDFLYMLNQIISRAIENSVLFEEKKFLAEKDSLTGVYNRRYFFEAMGNAIYNARRYKQEVGLMIFDVDGFKGVNDIYGHMVGDRVLKTIGGAMNNLKRRTDVVGRYGGDEFVILCNGTTLDACLVVGERARKKVETMQFDGIGDLRLTISMGCVSYNAVKDMEGEVADNMIKWSDKALYRAKANGKNQVLICEELFEKLKR